jgi:hypothetical protein
MHELLSNSAEGRKIVIEEAYVVVLVQLQAQSQHGRTGPARFESYRVHCSI